MTKTIEHDHQKTGISLQRMIKNSTTKLYGSALPEQDRQSIIGQTLKFLANGSPVTPNQIAFSLQSSPDKVTDTLRRLGAEFDQEGRIIGLGTIACSDCPCL